MNLVSSVTYPSLLLTSEGVDYFCLNHTSLFVPCSVYDIFVIRLHIHISNTSSRQIYYITSYYVMKGVNLLWNGAILFGPINLERITDISQSTFHTDLIGKRIYALKTTKKLC